MNKSNTSRTDNPTIKGLRDWLESITKESPIVGLPPALDTDTLFLHLGKGPCVSGKPYLSADFNWIGNKRTIYLLYPDHATDDYGHDTYAAWTDEPDFKEALKKAKLEAAMAQFEGKEPDRDDEGSIMFPIEPKDFALLMAFPGHISETHGSYDDLEDEDAIPVPD